MPENVNKIIDSFDKEESLDHFEDKILIDCIKYLKNRPITVADCIKISTKYFVRHFDHNIKRLLHLYPKDFKG